MSIWNRMRRIGTVKITYIVIAAILIGLTLVLSIGFYYNFLKYRLSERRVEAMSLTLSLSSELKSLYGDIIEQANLNNKSNEEKVLALNAIIQPLFDQISKQYPDYSIGYYDNRFDSIVAKDSDFKFPMLQKISESDPCFKTYVSGKLEIVDNTISVGLWKRKGSISVTIPFSTDNIAIGHVWANIETDDVYESVFEDTVAFLGLLAVLFFIPFALTWFMIRKVRQQLSSFAKSIFKDDDSVQIDTRILPELSPLLTAAKERSQQLRTYEAMVKNSYNSISTIDLDLKISSMNPAGQRMYGYTATEVSGREITLLAVPDEAQKMKEDFERIKTGEEVPTLHVQRKKKDGKVIDVSCSLSAIRDDQDNIIGIMAISRDITERKKMEAEMKRLDGLNIIGKMAASIAHEIRNPMTTVRGFLQMLGAKANLQVYKDYFQLMIEELDRANLIITEFLSLSRNTPIALSRQNLNTILTKLLPMLQADALRSEKNLIVELKEIPNLELNEQEIRQVILNLVRNGLESMSAGGVMTIKTYFENDKIVMSFSDQGSGIPSEVLGNIGKPFLTTKDNGTGLGLPVSYNIVYRHGGTISVETGNGGTTFLIKLPLEST